MKIFDEYNVSGVSLKDYKAILSADTSKVKEEHVNTSDLNFLVLCEVESLIQSDKIPAYLISKKGLNEYRLKNTPLKLVYIEKDSIGGDEGVKEIKKTNLLIYLDHEKYMVGKQALAHLCDIAGITCSSKSNKKDIFRYADMANSMYDNADIFTIYYRDEKYEDEKVRKIYGVWKSRFQPTPGKTLEIADIIEKYDDATIKEWYYDNERTHVLFSLPEIKGIKPYIRVIDSSIGVSSLVIRAEYEFPNGYIIGKEFLYKHGLYLKKKDFSEDVDAVHNSIKEFSLLLDSLEKDSVQGDRDTLEDVINASFEDFKDPKAKKVFQKMPVVKSALGVLETDGEVPLLKIAIVLMGIIAGLQKNEVDKNILRRRAYHIASRLKEGGW